MLQGDLRRLVLILVIVGIGLASLLVWNIDLRPLNFQRQGFRLGLDLRGGTHLVYEAQVPNPTADQMEGVAKVVERRVSAFGVVEPVIQIMGNKRLLVQLPGIKNIEEAKRLIGETARLEFKERVFNADGTFTDRDIGLTGDDLARAYPGQHPTTGAPVVYLEFKERGARIFADVTSRLAGTGNQLAIFLDNQELISPIVQQPIIGGQAFIEGRDFTPQRVRTIAIQLESGRLPVPLKLIQERDVDAILGADSLRKSLQAGVVGLALVLIFMVLYYRLLGALAGVALLIYGVIVLSVFKLIPVTLTLAGLAAFILSLGMAVDANVLIFERMKEELRTGRTLIAAIDEGFRRAWAAIRDSNITTLIAAAILYWLGNRLGESLVMGFAVVLFIGVLTSMFSALVVSHTLLRLLATTPARKYPWLFLAERPETSLFRVAGQRR